MSSSAGAAATTRQRQYLVIDLKSFYASVECVERGLDPMTARLVVADLSRTEKTICLAVSPAMKALGVRNRCRVFEIPAGIDYVVAPPRMRLYMERSADVYSVYLRWVSPDDIHVYSIDEAFIDVTGYLSLYGCSARELGERIREDVVRTTGIPATCGLGTNLYLAKVALDITAKHSPGFFGELDEETYRMTLWNHRPITDFWRVGPGTAERLATLGIHTMGQVAAYPQEPLYRLLGVDAEILIDHAWGIEPVTIADIKAYQPRTHCLDSAQVLGCDRDFGGARLIVREMADALSLELVDRALVAGSVGVFVGYAMTDEERSRARAGGDVRAWRRETSHAGGVVRLGAPSDSRRQLIDTALSLFDAHANRERPIHRLGVSLTDVHDKGEAGLQGELFRDPEELARERSRLETVNAVKQRFGRNALLMGTDLMPGATARERNGQIGGHRSGE